MHRIAVVAVPPVGTFELSIPDLIFGGVSLDGRPAYDVYACTAKPGKVASTGGLDVVVSHGLASIDRAETVIVTGTGAREHADPRVLTAVRRAARRGARIASI